MNRAVALLSALLALVPATAALSAEYPTRAIRMIVPFNAGGTATILARAITNGAEPILNQNFVIDNRGGANGIIGPQL
ncbi:MAG: tripartite tricarboxylate transporter substrate binding protein, partial [Betaproteobacteria bacterium]|nr:tripartite tricarboxylate transporter substrate binding protein [Betaproteobacteria bacterium]